MDGGPVFTVIRNLNLVGVRSFRPVDDDLVDGHILFQIHLPPGVVLSFQGNAGGRIAVVGHFSGKAAVIHFQTGNTDGFVQGVVGVIHQIQAGDFIIAEGVAGDFHIVQSAVNAAAHFFQRQDKGGAGFLGCTGDLIIVSFCRKDTVEVQSGGAVVTGQENFRPDFSGHFDIKEIGIALALESQFSASFIVGIEHAVFAVKENRVFLLFLFQVQIKGNGVREAYGIKWHGKIAFSIQRQSVVAGFLIIFNDDSVGQGTVVMIVGSVQNLVILYGFEIVGQSGFSCTFHIACGVGERASFCQFVDSG